MNTFNFFVSIFCIATVSGQDATVKSIEIKDNINHELAFGSCATKADLYVAVSDSKYNLTHLWPMIKPEEEASAIGLFDKDGKNITDDSFVKVEGKYPAFPGHFVIPSYEIKKIEYTSKDKKDEYKMYLIPPEVPEGKDGDKLKSEKFNLAVNFKCDDKDVTGFPATYEVTVLNNANTASLVASVLVVAASFLSIL